jgi:hypothetical protein
MHSVFLPALAMALAALVLALGALVRVVFVR